MFTENHRTPFEPMRTMRPLLQAPCALMLLTWSAAAQNLAGNPGFENGANPSPWFAFGPATLSSSTDQSHSGSRSGLVENRTATWNGVGQSFLGVMQAGKTYNISAWVRLVSGASEPVKLTIRKVDDGVVSFPNVANGTATSSGWTQLIGGYTHTTNGEVTVLTLYMEGPAAGVSFYADDLVVEDGADWQTEANARIEQIRKRDVQLLIVDAAGEPAPGTTVAIQQTRHHFGFGSAINGNISNPAYAEFFRANFEWAVMENESKWYSNEPSQSNVTYTVADSITNFCYTNGITLRGHAIFWCVDQYVQNWVKNLDDTDLRVALTNRLNSAVNHFKDTFAHWDVNNEMLHGDYFENRLGDWVRPWMFQHARSLDADVKLFVNDYNVVSGNETAAYKQQILGLIASNAPVGGIGAQGHFGATVNPSLTEARIDSLAELGLPIWISEYDSLNSDETVRADNLETLYRIAFSKPSVEGILMWGFWAGSHWRGADAAIVDLDWTLNEAGQRYQSLLAEWTTVTNGVAGAGGEYDFRGFHGEYDITLTPPGGEPTLRRITLDPGSGTYTAILIAHSSGERPVLHNPGIASATGPFHFQLTGNAGRTYAIQGATNASNPGWTTLTNVFNPVGTIWITNPGPILDAHRIFRAELLP